MIAKKVSPEQYNQSINEYNVVFNSSKFCELNKYKVDWIDYLLISKETSNRFAICFGIENKIAKAPFSAPYSLPIEMKNNISVNNYDEFFESLDVYAIENDLDGLQITLPPIFYDEHKISSIINTSYRHNYDIINIDLNYSINLKKMFTPEYINLIPHKARSPFRIANSSNLKLIKCENITQIKTAYDIIVENHFAKGFPVKMSYDNLIDTLEIIPNDVFLISDDNRYIASAIIYYSKKNIAQVIYWGDIPGYGKLKPMHYLVHQLIQYYGKKDLDYLDIGPSTENSIPNYGLCDFKESIGCERSLKFTIRKKLS